MQWFSGGLAELPECDVRRIGVPVGARGIIDWLGLYLSSIFCIPSNILVLIDGDGLRSCCTVFGLRKGYVWLVRGMMMEASQTQQKIKRVVG
jgi:hypothetical protein